jgi:hypothetical protein
MQSFAHGGHALHLHSGDTPFESQPGFRPYWSVSFLFLFSTFWKIPVNVFGIDNDRFIACPPQLIILLRRQRRKINHKMQLNETENCGQILVTNSPYQNNNKKFSYVFGKI